MGYRVSWIARQGTDTEQLLRFSRRALTGERHEFPDLGWYLLEMPHVKPAWVLLIADGSDQFMELEPSHAQTLSEDGNETLYFICSDTVMATHMSYYRSGEGVWAIDYECEGDTQSPEILGQPPEVVLEMLARQKAIQAQDDDADYLYDLTAEVGRALTGFRHDTPPATDDPEPFQVLG